MRRWNNKYGMSVIHQPPRAVYASPESVNVSDNAEVLSHAGKSRMILTITIIGFCVILAGLLFAHISLPRAAILTIGIAQLLFIPGFLLSLVCSPIRIRATPRGDDESDGAWDIVERLTISVSFSIILSSGTVFVLARARRMFPVVLDVIPMDFIGLAIAFNLLLIALALVRVYGARWLPWAIGILGITATLSVPLVGGVHAAQLWAWPIAGATGIAMVGAIVMTRFVFGRRWRTHA